MAKELDPQAVLAESGTDDPLEFVRLGIDAARSEQFERGLIFLTEAYRRLMKDKESKVPPGALSFYGLCLAVHKGRVKEAAEFCQLAIDKEFYNGEHYLNLGRVWVAGRSRRKAIEAIDRGLMVAPDSKHLHQLRGTLGVRKGPVIPFLNRDNPLNVTLGRMRHEMRVKAAAARKKKAKNAQK